MRMRLADSAVISRVWSLALVGLLLALPVARRDSSVESFTRCASPPERVVAGWPRWM